MPKANVVSAFSFKMSRDYKLGSTACTGRYAGCMTAPCFYEPGHKSPPADGDYVQCKCPIYSGVYQVGQTQQVCPIPPGDKEAYVWSASNTVASGGSGQ